MNPTKMDLPTKPECSWDCEGCIICEPPIPILNNEDNKDNEYNENNEDNEEESWENDEFIDKLKTEMQIKEEKIRTKEENKLYFEKLKQKKELRDFHKYIRRCICDAKAILHETYFMYNHCSKLYDVWTDYRFISLLKIQLRIYKKDVYYDNDNANNNNNDNDNDIDNDNYNYKKYLFCNKEDCCCKKIAKAIDDMFEAKRLELKRIDYFENYYKNSFVPQE